MIINLPNVAALIRAVSTVNPGNVAAVERIAADRPIDVGDLSALDAAAADALAEGADPEQLRADLDATRADLEKVGAAVGDGDLTADELARWIDIAKAKIFIVEALEKTIKDLEMERDAAVDAAVAAVEAAEAARNADRRQ